MNTEMQENTELKEQEVIETSSAMNKVKCSSHFRSRAVFRLLVRLNENPNPNFIQEQLVRPSSSTASNVISSAGQGDHERKRHPDAQETEKQSDETVTHTQTKRMEMCDKDSERPFHQEEQSLLRRAIRILFFFFIILGVIVSFMIASQYVYSEAGQISRSWDLNKCTNSFVKLRFGGMYNPPV